jgi:hypothetical protein
MADEVQEAATKDITTFTSMLQKMRTIFDRSRRKHALR